MSQSMIFSVLFLTGLTGIVLSIYIDGLKYKISSAETDASYWKRVAELRKEHLDDSFKTNMERVRNDSN
jgi:hypothetical protein